MVGATSAAGCAGLLDGADHRRGCGMHLACRSVAAEIGGRADRLEQVHSDAFNNLVKFVFRLTSKQR